MSQLPLYLHLHPQYTLRGPNSFTWRDHLSLRPLHRYTSQHQISQLFDPVYNTVHTTLREGEAALKGGFSLSQCRVDSIVDGIEQLGDLVDTEESVRVEDKDQNDLTG